jgi:NAD(P)-dependent dehydrogenase (short-subunit alcohol dehydrogenase family)
MSTSPLLILVTGSNQGLGYAAVQQLVADNGKFHVLAAARSQAKADEAIKKILAATPSANPALLESIVIDLSSDESIQAAAKLVSQKHGKLDILVNNAAIPASDPSKSIREKFNAAFDTNVTGTAVVTEAFIPLLRKSTAPAPGRRIVNVSSGLGSLELTLTDVVPVVEKYAPYSISKSALNMLSLYTRKKLIDDKIAVVMISPGFCATNLNNYTGHLTPEEGGANIVKTITRGDFESVNGKFFGTETETFPW